MALIALFLMTSFLFLCVIEISVLKYDETKVTFSYVYSLVFESWNGCTWDVVDKVAVLI